MENLVTNVQCDGCLRGYPIKSFKWFVDVFSPKGNREQLRFCPSCVRDMTFKLEGHAAQALEFYANPKHYESKGGEALFSDVLFDGGELARNALAAMDEEHVEKRKTV